MNSPKVIVINLSSSGSRLGGAAIAAEYHSQAINAIHPIELWRMWDHEQISHVGTLKIKNYKTTSKLARFKKILPKEIVSCFSESRILQDILDDKPDIIHLQNPLPSLEFEKISFSASQAGIKVVASTHGFFEVMNPNYGLNIYQKIAWNHLVTKPIINSLQYLDGIISGYPQEKEILVRHGVPESKIRLVPNGVNPFFLQSPTSNQLDSTLSTFSISQNHPILLFIGNHTSNKGLDTVLKVASQLSRPVSVVIGGRLLYPEEPIYWKDKITQPNNVNVIFTDFLSVEEQRVLYSLSTILLFPSLSDTLPLTILEAMASGLPVIAYDVGGISYQLDNQAGEVVVEGNTEAFLKSVNYLIDHPNHREKLILNAKARQQKYFSWDSAAKETLKLYLELMN